jgi:glutaminyl-tRNA synthetase
MSVLEQALRDDLDAKAERAFVVLKPLKLIIDNFDANHSEPCSAPKHPHHEDWGRRDFNLSKELWIEEDDFMVEPIKGFFRLYPPMNGEAGSRVRLRHGFVIECTGYDTDANGKVTAVHANYFPDSKSGTPESNNYKVKGNLHWVSAKEGIKAEIRVYDRLFTDPHPDSGDKNFLEAINQDSKQILHAYLEPSLNNEQAEQLAVIGGFELTNEVEVMVTVEYSMTINVPAGEDVEDIIHDIDFDAISYDTDKITYVSSSLSGVEF